MKIIKCKITEQPKSIFDPMPKVIVTFEDATPANNWVRYILDSDQSQNYWIGQAILTIKKIG